MGKRGDLLKDALSLLKPVWIQANERLLGIQTEPKNVLVPMGNGLWWQKESGALSQYADGTHYASQDYWNVRKMIRTLKPGPEDVFYDIGSGLGRVVCVMARRPVRKCVGIELYQPLCEMARENAANLRGRRAPIEILCGDAASADLSEGTLYFLFHPFGERTMRSMLENIRQSLGKNPRTIRIAYCVPVLDSLFEQAGWLRKIHQIRLMGGYHASFWQNG